jgi:ATP-dependent Lon protease
MTEINTEKNIETIPVLPLRDIVVFPHMIVPLFVGRDKSVRALETVMQKDKKIILVTQKDATLDDPTAKDFYRFGTIGSVLQLLKLPDGTVKVLIEGGERVLIENFHETNNFFEATVTLQPEADDEEIKELEAVSRAALAQFDQYVKLSKKVATDVLTSLAQIEHAQTALSSAGAGGAGA